MVNAATLGKLVGGVRVGVGVALLARPAIAGADDASSQLLVRTIGVRDLVLGLGMLTASDDERASWVRAGLTSDVADVALAAYYRQGPAAHPWRRTIGCSRDR